MLLSIYAVDQTADYFQVVGDATQLYAAGDYIQVQKSTGNNGVYHLSSVTLQSGYTRLYTEEPIPSAVADGAIVGGVYAINFSSEEVSGKSPLIVPPFGVNTATSLRLNGKAVVDFGEYQQENVVRVMENFASATAPSNPTIGQHWYDHTNQSMKVWTGSSWSADVNVEAGDVTFRDPQHPTPNTRYILTADDPVGTPESGVVLFPAVNPNAGDSLFRVASSDGTSILSIQYNGVIRAASPLSVTSTSTNTLAGPVTINTSNTGTTGITVNKTLVVADGDIIVSSGRQISVTSGPSITLGASTVTLKGTSSTAGTVVQASTGDATATFGDTTIAFAVLVSGTTINATTINVTTLGVTGTATITTGAITTLAVSGASTLSTTSATSLTVSGSTTLAAATATTLGVSGTSTLAATSIASLTVSGSATLGAVEIASLEVTGTTTLDSVNVTTTALVTDLNVTTSSTVPDPTMDANIANKGYVDIQVGTREPVIAGGLATQYLAGDKTFKDFDPTLVDLAAISELDGALVRVGGVWQLDTSNSAGGWDALTEPTIASGVLTLDLTAPVGFKVLLDQNITSIIFTNAPVDRTVAFAIQWIQDAVGGFTVDWPISVLSEDGSEPLQPDPTPNSSTIQSFITFDGAATVRVAGALPPPQSIIVPIGDQGAFVAAGTNVDSFHIPYNFFLTAVKASLRTAQATGAEVTVDVLRNGASVLSTTVQVTNTERTSATNTTQPVLSTDLLNEDDEISFNVSIGDGTAVGLKVILIGHPV